MNDARDIRLDVHQATISVAILDSAGKLVNLIHCLQEMSIFPCRSPDYSLVHLFCRFPRPTQGGSHSARALGKPGLFPEFLPLPDAGSLVEDPVAELVRQH
jgi:hypothetical protein